MKKVINGEGVISKRHLEASKQKISQSLKDFNEKNIKKPEKK